jgi:hypothetical protein
MDETAQEHRNHAERLRVSARKEADPMTQKLMLALADGWELMARARKIRRIPIRARRSYV